MNERNFIDKEVVQIGNGKYVISSIPAFTAQRMLLKAFSAFSSGSIAAIPEDLILEILSYSAKINENGAEVQLMNQELVEMMIADPVDLIELESRMVEKNFGFLADGRLTEIMSRLSKMLTHSA